MKFLFSAIIAVSLGVPFSSALANTNTNSQVWNCTANEFYAAPYFQPGDTERAEITVDTGETRTAIFKDDHNNYSADFQTLGENHEQNVVNAPVKLSIFSRENLDNDTYETALEYMALVLNNPKVRQATSYKSYQILKESGSVYYVGQEFYAGSNILARSIMWPGKNIVGACK